MFARLASSASKPRAIAAGIVASGAAGAAAGLGVALCNEDCIEAPKYAGWPHKGPLDSFDYAAIRRGFQVYRQVCATCHSIEYVSFRQLVNVTHTEDEVKKMAATFEVEDAEPNDEGEMFERPAKLVDIYPGPYKNAQAAKAANNGAQPPDLTLMVKARHGGVDYIFALLTGYTASPHGKGLQPGLHYNPYFPGGAIAMPPPLVDGQVEYEDGTPATISQMAKDVSCFLAWTAEPEHDTRKKFGMKALMLLGTAVLLTGYYKRRTWAPWKTRKITYVDP